MRKLLCSLVLSLVLSVTAVDAAKNPRNGEVPTIAAERNQQYSSHVTLPVKR